MLTETHEFKIKKVPKSLRKFIGLAKTIEVTVKPIKYLEIDCLEVLGLDFECILGIEEVLDGLSVGQIEHLVLLKILDEKRKGKTNLVHGLINGEPITINSIESKPRGSDKFNVVSDEVESESDNG